VQTRVAIERERVRRRRMRRGRVRYRDGLEGFGVVDEGGMMAVSRVVGWRKGDMCE
jgi:hypothetical protein